ncbi:MAG: cytochrome C oxidase subunit II [Bacteroidetes bacterium]|nr:cytochrome C oxidase subunit II [Bacteroidota bacterium]
MQLNVFLSWSIASIIVMLVFYIVYRRSKKEPASISYDIINNKRFKLLYGIVILLFIAFFAALSYLPYPTKEEPDQIIGVKAKMFLFELTQDTLEVNKLIEFRITSEDVTHAFGVYDSTGMLLGQVQAMPNYINRLRMRFTEPGNYSILCLEYCGPLHHQMRKPILVR